MKKQIKNKKNIYLIFFLMALFLIISFLFNQFGYKNYITDEGRYKNLYEYSNSSSVISESIDKFVKEADTILTLDMCEYYIDEGGRMLDTAKEVKHRIEVLCFSAKYLEANNLDVGKSNLYKEKVKEYLMYVCTEYPNWHPIHFLDTAEMTYAVAFGYDFLYDELNGEQRIAIEQALIDKGLALSCKENYSYVFSMAKTNWNQVCNSAMGMAALVMRNSDIVIDKSRITDTQIFSYLPAKEKITSGELCDAIIRRTIRNLPEGLIHMTPDGAYSEGTTYWEYANTYTTYFLNALKKYDRSSYVKLLEENTWLKETILYPMYITGNSDKTFSYYDGEDEKLDLYPSIYLAKEYYALDKSNENLLKAIRWYESKEENIDNIYQLLLYDNEYDIASYTDEELEGLGIPQDKIYTNTELAIITDGFEEQELYLGIKAGNFQKMTHQDLDVGSFVLDINNIRWIEDYGPEDYNVPNYWKVNKERWMYYKKRAESHSTLNIIEDNEKVEDQNILASCKFEKLETSSNISKVTIDMSNAYFKSDNQVVREFTIEKDKKIINIKDTVNLDENVDVYSFLNISNGIEINLIDDKNAVLSKDGQKVNIQLECDGAKLIKMPKISIRNDVNEYNECNIEDKDNYKLAVYCENVKSCEINIKISYGE